MKKSVTDDTPRKSRSLPRSSGTWNRDTYDAETPRTTNGPNRPLGELPVTSQSSPERDSVVQIGNRNARTSRAPSRYQASVLFFIYSIYI